MTTVSASCESTTGAKSSRPVSLALITICAVIVAAFLPLVGTHAQQLWAKPHYQFFPIVLLGAAVLAWTRRSAFTHLQPGGIAVSVGLTACAWLLLARAEFVNSSWLAAVAMLVLVQAGVYAIGGAALVRELLAVWVFLWLLVPPPFGLDNTLILALQTLTTRWSSALLDLVGVHHVIAGHVMEVAGQRLFVEEACAGINSLFSILACTLFFVFYTHVPPVRAVLLLLASVAWVVMANVARVFLIAYLFKRWNMQLTEGWRHEALGYFLFAVALGLIWSTNRLLLFLTPVRYRNTDMPESTASKDENPAQPALAFVLSRSWLCSWVTAAVFGLLLVGHFLLYGVSQPAFAGSGQVAACVLSLKEDSLSSDLDGWRRVSMKEENLAVNNAYGQFSKIWQYQGEAQFAAVSLDYPFPSWHELNECYYGQGWDFEETTNHVAIESGPSHYTEVKMKKSGLRWGYLLYCQFDSTGQVLTAPRRGMVTSTVQRHESALKRLFGWEDRQTDLTQPVGTVYQQQLFVETYRPLSDDERAKTTQRFFRVHQEINQHLFRTAEASQQ